VNNLSLDNPTSRKLLQDSLSGMKKKSGKTDAKGRYIFSDKLSAFRLSFFSLLFLLFVFDTNATGGYFERLRALVGPS
jgi:hypothetical protein